MEAYYEKWIKRGMWSDDIACSGRALSAGIQGSQLPQAMAHLAAVHVRVPR
jgi:hypothetical protein